MVSLVIMTFMGFFHRYDASLAVHPRQGALRSQPLERSLLKPRLLCLRLDHSTGNRHRHPALLTSTDSDPGPHSEAHVHTPDLVHHHLRHRDQSVPVQVVLAANRDRRSDPAVVGLPVRLHFREDLRPGAKGRARNCHRNRRAEHGHRHFHVERSRATRRRPDHGCACGRGHLHAIPAAPVVRHPEVERAVRGIEK
jgi:hypothetical protein